MEPGPTSERLSCLDGPIARPTLLPRPAPLFLPIGLRLLTTCFGCQQSPLVLSADVSATRCFFRHRLGSLPCVRPVCPFRIGPRGGQGRCFPTSPDLVGLWFWLVYQLTHLEIFTHLLVSWNEALVVDNCFHCSPIPYQKLRNEGKGLLVHLPFAQIEEKLSKPASRPPLHLPHTTATLQRCDTSP
jgi:hypothetical protein